MTVNSSTARVHGIYNCIYSQNVIFMINKKFWIVLPSSTPEMMRNNSFIYKNRKYNIIYRIYFKNFSISYQKLFRESHWSVRRLLLIMEFYIIDNIPVSGVFVFFAITSRYETYTTPFKLVKKIVDYITLVYFIKTSK